MASRNDIGPGLFNSIVTLGRTSPAEIRRGRRHAAITLRIQRFGLDNPMRSFALRSGSGSNACGISDCRESFIKIDLKPRARPDNCVRRSHAPEQAP